MLLVILSSSYCHAASLSAKFLDDHILTDANRLSGSMAKSQPVDSHIDRQRPATVLHAVLILVRTVVVISVAVVDVS